MVAEKQGIKALQTQSLEAIKSSSPDLASSKTINANTESQVSLSEEVNKIRSKESPAVEGLKSSISDQKNLAGTAEAEMNNRYNAYSKAQSEGQEDRANKLKGEYESKKFDFEQEDLKLTNLESQLEQETKAYKANDKDAAKSEDSKAAKKKKGKDDGSTSRKSPSETMKDIEDFLNQMAENEKTNGYGNPWDPLSQYYDATRTVIQAIQQVYQKGISTNAFVNKAKNYTVGTLAQAGKATAEAGIAMVVDSSSQAAYGLRTMLAMLNGYTSLANESQQYWNDVAKRNFVKGVSDGADNIQSA